MKQQDFTLTISTNANPPEAFKCINRVKAWWTENLEGKTEKLNDEFTVHFDDVHVSTQRLVEVIPDKRISWLVISSNLSFINHKQEWNNTKITFDISRKGDKTEIRFTHQGLIPQIECFEACSNAWTEYIQQSLLSLMNSGKGKPTKTKKN